MERLPDEILAQILRSLDPETIVKTQLVCARFLRLTRDNLLWKRVCFDRSFNERRRRRHLDFESRNRLPRYADLTRALDILFRREGIQDTATVNAEAQRHVRAAQEREKALSNWDPGYPGENINYYEEYIQRHAPIKISWLQAAKYGTGEEGIAKEAIGMGILYDDDGARAGKVFSALDDGSIGVWQLCKDSSTQPGRLLARSPAALLCQSPNLRTSSSLADIARSMMTENGAVERISVDNSTQRGYFASQTRLLEVDLSTLKLISHEEYPFPISALSEAKHPTPITVGTNMSLHLYDPRAPRNNGSAESKVVRIERIGGLDRSDFHRLLTGDRPRIANLPQPGPLSIVHMPPDRAWDGNGDIWVAGRFTHLLNYDRRYFPRIRGTFSSGARISCLRVRPQPFIPRELDQMSRNQLSIASINEAKSVPGSTLIAAGEYKGKGSLEQYGLSSNPRYTTLSSDTNTATCIKNRQTASGSKLLSVANHGGKLVYSDGDGNIKWMERDGFTPIRHWNLSNEYSGDPSFATLADLSGNSDSRWRRYINAEGSHDVTLPPDDIVQLLLPTMPKSTIGHSSIGDDNLVIWTGEGRLGVLGFGHEKWDWSKLDEPALEYEEMKRRNEEREYEGMMGRALRRQQDELNFVRNFGLDI